jgi:hypothetical protein
MTVHVLDEGYVVEKIIFKVFAAPRVHLPRVFRLLV